jgi:hypothetical protein
VFDLREFELESELEWKALNKPSETQKWYGPKARLKHFLSYFNKYTILGKLSLKLQIALVLPCTFFRQRKDRKDQDRNLPGKELHDIIEDSFWVSVASLTVLWHGKQIKMGNKDTLKLLRVDGDIEIEVS